MNTRVRFHAAAFAGAPGNAFTVFGATPLRNAAVIDLQATTNIAAATPNDLRYDGEIATGTTTTPSMSA